MRTAGSTVNQHHEEDKSSLAHDLFGRNSWRNTEIFHGKAGD